MDLSEKEKRVLELRETHTLQQISNMFSVTKERIRQIEIKAKGKLAFRPKNGIELLPTITRTALIHDGIRNIEEAKSKTDGELLHIRNIGRKGLKAIRTSKSRAPCVQNI